MSHLLRGHYAPIVLSVCLVMLLLGPSAPFAQVIDDFEQSDFDVDTVAATTAPSFDNMSVTQGIHCIAPVREVRIDSAAGGIASAGLHVGLVDDEVATVMPSEGARLEFSYLLPVPLDITFGGLVNRVEVILTVGLPDATLELILVETADNWQQRDIVISGPGTYTFMLEDFAGPDLTMISEVHVNLVTTREGDYHIADIRLRETGTEDTGYTVVTPLVEAPSVEPVQVLVSVPSEDGAALVDAHLINLSVLGSESLPIPGDVIPVEVLIAESGEGTGMPGRRANVSVKSIPGKADHGDGAFDMHVGVEPVDYYPTIPNMPMLMMVAGDP